MTDPLDYGDLLQQALRSLVRRSLSIVAQGGMPGEHHFYLAFRTDVPGVELPTILKEQYPDEMTIVLKTQFQDLAVEHQAFSVSLFFSGVLYRLTVPFAALVSFSDPSVGFQVVFQPVETDDEEDEEQGSQVSDETPAESAVVVGGDNVVAFPGAFRKDS